MKLNMIVTPAIGQDAAGSLADFKTDMLLLGRFQDGGMGPVQTFDEKTNGKLSRLLVQRKFTGRLGNRFTFQNPRGAQNYLLVVGLGKAAEFSGVSIAKLVGIAVHKAVKKDCRKISIPFFPNRAGLKLSSLARRPSSNCRSTSTSMASSPSNFSALIPAPPPRCFVKVSAWRPQASSAASTSTAPSACRLLVFASLYALRSNLPQLDTFTSCLMW
jgi:hypothetical protein